MLYFHETDHKFFTRQYIYFFIHIFLAFTVGTEHRGPSVSDLLSVCYLYCCYCIYFHTVNRYLC